MRIDRSIFLAMTATLAAGLTGACHVYVDGPVRPVARPAPPQAPQPPATASRPAPPGQRVVVLRPSGGTTPAPSTTPPSTPPTPVTTCLDDSTASIGDCNGMRSPDSTCAPFSFPAQQCAAYRTYLDPKVAAVAVSCMTSLSSKQLCDGVQSYNCGKTALAQACPDPNVVQLCQIATGPCKTTASDCSALVSGLNEQGKQSVAQCVSKGCQGGLYSCVEGLAQTGQSGTNAFH